MPLIDTAPDAVARIYASSLFDLAKAEGHGSPERAEQILSELEDILELARSDAKFAEFLSSMILPARSREVSLKKILTGQCSELTLRFLLILNRKGRLSHLPAIATAFEQRVQDAYGRVEVDVYTAEAISQDEVNQIRDRLRDALRREPVVHAYTDPSMLGGLRLQIGDQLIDASVSSRLRKMRTRLSEHATGQIRANADRLTAD
jgi:F-type H+-transporting ATPase subunit delta